MTRLQSLLFCAAYAILNVALFGLAVAEDSLSIFRPGYLFRSLVMLPLTGLVAIVLFHWHAHAGWGWSLAAALWLGAVSFLHYAVIGMALSSV